MKDIRYVLYVRRSSESEDKQVQSVDDQLAVMLDVAKKRGLKVVVKLKESKTAKAPFERPEFAKMLAMIERGEVDGILCWQINRLSRNPTENGILQQMLQDEKIRSIQTHDRAYLSDDNAVVFSVEASIANQFIRDLRKNVKRGIGAKIRGGGISGPAHAGYLNNRIDKTIEVDPLRFPLIRKAFDMFLTGDFSVPQVLRAMNEDWGYLTPQRRERGGVPLSRSGLYVILNNPRYSGWIPNPYENGKFYKANFPSMITEEEYDKVQRMLGVKGKPRLCASKQFALKGFIKCGECGCMITAELQKKKLANGTVNEHTYYHCTRKRPCEQRGAIREQDLFDKVNSMLDEYELTPKLYEWGMEALKEMADNEVAERNDVQAMSFKSLEAIQAQLDKLLDLVARDIITPEEYKAKSSSLKEDHQRRSDEQTAMAERTKNWYEFVGKQLDTLTLANAKFVKGDLGDKKDILLAIGQNPVILDKELIITPNKWMIPVKENVRSIREQLDMVRTAPDKIQKTTEVALKSLWCPGLDSNQRP
jgi:site-specific DNA recombinase